jgi:hypothetical protein
MTKCSWLTLSRVMIAVVAIAMWSCMDNNVSGPDELASGSNLGGVTERGITPTTLPGNFTSSDDTQLCYDLVKALGKGDEFDGTLDYTGYKVNIPDSDTDGNVTVTIPDGVHLNWESENVTVVGIIVKGGNNFNAYSYIGTGFDWDNNLVSPAVQQKKKWIIPAVSHYNVCYYKPPVDDEGCTRGYWRNHTSRWAGVATTDDFDATFGVDLFSPDITLLTAIKLTGGGVNQLAAQATAALLNSYGGVANADGNVVDYAYTTAQVIQMVQDAVANGIIGETATLFDVANNAGCPLSGTKAD